MRAFSVDDIVELIIYLALGVIALLVSAYRNKQRRQAQSGRIPGTNTSQSRPDVRPDLGPLAEILGIPELANPEPEPVSDQENREQNIRKEDMLVEEEEFMFERSGFDVEQQPSLLEKEGLEMEKTEYEGTPVFDSTKETLVSDSITDTSITNVSEIYIPISNSEIKGEEISDDVMGDKIDWKKAVIYSEILKRRQI
jgi:hypothetical protein